jgi:toxin ParE1/3/4
VAHVDWSVDASRDLADIASFIAADSPEHARAFVDELRSATAKLSDFPALGRAVPELEDPEMRELIVRGYRIIYQLRGDIVGIVAVIHGARDRGASGETERPG